MLELTEFFVEPTHQSKGLGSALLARAFPLGRGEIRSIIATTDVRALARYYAAGTAARFPSAHAERRAWPRGCVQLAGAVALDARFPNTWPPSRPSSGRIVDFARGAAELRWILQQREGYLFRRGGQFVGYRLRRQAGRRPDWRARRRRLASAVTAGRKAARTRSAPNGSACRCLA